MDCNSSNITFKGKGKNTYSFDVSTPEMRSQIIFSIEEKIADINEEISRHDYEIAKLQIELQTLMDDDDVTIENIMAYKQGFHSVEEIEKTLVELDTEITQLSDGLKAGIKSSDESKEKREQFFSQFIVLMNTKKHIIDIEGTDDYEDVFTKRGTTISGSEETVFYVARLISTAEMIKHECPIIMDSFRAEDLSTDKEERVLTMFSELSNQCIQPSLHERTCRGTVPCNSREGRKGFRSIHISSRGRLRMRFCSVRSRRELSAFRPFCIGGSLSPDGKNYRHLRKLCCTSSPENRGKCPDRHWRVHRVCRRSAGIRVPN